VKHTETWVEQCAPLLVMTQREEPWGSATVQRPNVINANGVHFNNVSGNQELLALNCGEHKPESLSCNMTASPPGGVR